MPRLNVSSFALLSLPFMVLMVGVGLGCQPATYEDDGLGEGDTTNPGDGDGDTNPGDGDGDDTGGEATFNGDPNVPAPCGPGQKCTVLSPAGMTPVYECVTDDTDKLPYESCTPAPSTGQDGCPSSHACITPVGSPTGQCLRLCSSDAGCDSGLCTAPPDLQIPVCGTICDPLGPQCPELHVCQRVRQANFVCQYPLADDDGVTADGCSAGEDTGCAEGFVCETGGVVPGCAETSCCTALCDLSEPETCTSPMVCGDLSLDPQPQLENVGACYVPQ